MKKVYAKPQIAFEDFSLSISVAAGCNHFSNQAESVCGYVDPLEPSVGPYFADGIATMCVFKPGDDFPCYDVPSESFVLFVS